MTLVDHDIFSVVESDVRYHLYDHFKAVWGEIGEEIWNPLRNTVPVTRFHDAGIMERYDPRKDTNLR